MTTVYTQYRTMDKTIEVSTKVKSIVVIYDVERESERKRNLLANGYGEKFDTMSID